MTKPEQTFDAVHDTQFIYRKLLDCTARPGKVHNIYDAVAGMTTVYGLSPVLAAIAFTLIDREVSYHIICRQAEEAAHYFQWRTFSQQAPPSEADYIFVQDQLDDVAIHELMKQVKRGTLRDPHNSATLVVRADNLLTNIDYGLRLYLSGPGIKGERSCDIAGLPFAWIGARQMVNKEFPMGVDMFFVTDSGDVMAVPRTTKIESECL